jgi:uncharacterized protein YbaP (TraB family)
MRLFLAMFLWFLPAALWAACTGTDLRTTLTEVQRAEIAARLDGVPYPEGNHWIATRGDRTIHLIGTIHIDDPRLDPIAAALAPIIRSADHLLVEANKETSAELQNAMATRPELAFLTGKTLIELMPEDAWAEIAQAAQARGIPPFMAAKFQPWYLSLMLSMSPCTMKVMSEGKMGLDGRIMEIAEAAGVPTSSLEPYDTVFRLFNQDPLEVQIEMLTLGTIPPAAAEDASFTLAEQYFSQEIMAALETARVTTRPYVDMPVAAYDALFDDMMGLVMDQRNIAWIDPIEAAEGDTIVVAAGALHLGGENGVLNLLAQRGYALTRQPF